MIRERIDELVKLHGSERAAAKAVGIANSHFFRLRRGLSGPPGPEVLRRLGLPETVALQPVTANWPDDGLQWRPVVGFEGLYSVSEAGTVRSEPRLVAKGRGGAMRRVGGQVLKAKIDKDGYLVVALHRAGAKPDDAHVHRLVLEAFKGPCPPGLEACHEDGNGANCTLNNLRWDTRQANANDKMAHGTMIIGEQHHKAKLTEAQVRAIRDDTRPERVVARDYGVSSTTVGEIKRRKSWSWLK